MKTAVKLELKDVDQIPFQEASIDIWDKKYRLTAKDGTPVDQEMDGTWRRVAQAGITRIHSGLESGDAVNVARAADGTVIARGLARLSAADARTVAGKKSADAHALLPALPDEQN